VRDVLALSALDVDVWTHTVVVGGWIEARVSVAQLEALRGMGMEPVVVEEDLAARAAASYAEVEAINRRDGPGFYDNYRREAEIRSRLESLAAGSPSYASAFVLGTSLEGREVWGIRLSAPDRLGNPRSARPVVLFNATQHAREWVAPMAAAYFVERALSARSSDAVVRDLFNRLEMVVVPVSNPDGYAYTWAGQRFWRKNMYRDAGGTLYGVDLNRNWGYQWGGVGASTNPTSETYRGVSAFSEPESRVLRDFALANPRLAAHVDVHTYGQLILSPWCYTSAPPPDAAFFTSAGAAIRWAMTAVNGLGFTAGQWYSALYPSSGTAVDWVYGDRGVKSWTFELRGGRFDPPASEILPGCTETFAGLVEVARTALRAVCSADVNLDGVVDFNDLLAYLNLFNAQDPMADVDEDGVVDFNDFLVYLNLFNAGC
jgi:murein tripeptide amidase MpaA